MSLFLFLVGSVSFVVCLVLLIIKVLWRKPKKKTVIALIASFLTLCIGFCTFETETDEPAASNSAALEASVPVATAEPTQAPTVSPTAEPTATPEPEPEADINLIKSLLEISLADSYDYYAVEGDETGFIISIGTEGLAAATALAKYSGYDENYEPWVEAKESTLAMYATTYESIESFGMEDPALMVVVVNDSNTENWLLVISDGIITYDVLADQ